MPPPRASVAIARVDGADWVARDRPSLIHHLDDHAAVVLRGALPDALRRSWLNSVYSDRTSWISDFGGEQFAVGRAFYTHLETGQSRLYFEDAAASDARVERLLPGMQGRLRETLARLVGGVVRPRPGFCGPGVHIFPAGGKVARKGGVVHFDVEGLSPLQTRRLSRTVTLIAMLQPPIHGGGLRLWNATSRGDEHPTDDDLRAPARTLRYEPSDLVLMDSRRLHQIRPFRGDLDRVSLTVHAVEVDRGVWEAWF